MTKGIFGLQDYVTKSRLPHNYFKCKHARTCFCNNSSIMCMKMGLRSHSTWTKSPAFATILFMKSPCSLSPSCCGQTKTITKLSLKDNQESQTCSHFCTIFTDLCWISECHNIMYSRTSNIIWGLKKQSGDHNVVKVRSDEDNCDGKTENNHPYDHFTIIQYHNI